MQIKVDPDLLARIDGEAGRLGQTRTTFILRCVEGALPVANGGSDRVAGPARTPATAPRPAARDDVIPRFKR